MKKIAELIRRKLRRKQKIYVPSPSLEMKKIMSEIKNLSLRKNQGEDITKRILFLRFLADMIKVDIMSDTSLSGLLGDARSKKDSLYIPLECRDQDGNKVDVFTNQKRELDFEKDYVITNVWNKDRMAAALKNVQKNGFVYEEKNHYAHYYDGMDLFYVYNGNHHTQAASYFKTGKMTAEICNMRVLFEHMETDGEYWISTHTGEKIDTVEDFRVAILYELCRFLNQNEEKCVTNDTE